MTPERIREFMKKLGEKATSPGIVYLTGGSTALLLGIRSQTVDIDVKLDPEPGGVFEAIARIKEELEMNVELAAPDQFVPALPGWRERSPYITTEGKVEFRHYDLYGQALSKIERGYDMDLADARAFATTGAVDARILLELFDSVQADLVKYPAIDAIRFRVKVREFADEFGNS